MAMFIYSSIVFRQRTDPAPEFCVFHAPVGQVLKWASIPRLEPGQKGIQRQKNSPKVRAISRFFSTDARNTIPTSIVLTLNKAHVKIEPLVCQAGRAAVHDANLAHLKINTGENGEVQPGFVIDGQHRLYGIEQFKEDTLVSVVAILGADDAEKAFQFLVINNKATKVNRDHIRALTLSYDKDELSKRLERSARLSLSAQVDFVRQVDNEETSPFKGIMSWPLNPEDKQRVPPAAIEACFEYIKDQRTKYLNDDEDYLEFFLTIWRTIKAKWPKHWRKQPEEKSKQSKLLGKVGVVCMTQYVVDLMSTWSKLGDMSPVGEINLSDMETVEKYVEGIIDKLESDFWNLEWDSTSYDTRAGREAILAALDNIYQNKAADLPWYDGLKIISKVALDRLKEDGQK